MNSTLKKTLQYALFLGIAVALLYLTFAKVNPTELWANIRAVQPAGLVGIIAIGFLAVIFRGMRWVQLLNSMGYDVSGARAISAVAFSYLVNLVTPRVGEVARCTALNRTDKVPIDKLVGTVVLERVVDTLLFGLVVLTTLVLSTDELGAFLAENGAQLPELNTSAMLALAAGGIAVLALLIATRKKWMQWGPAKKILGFVEGLLIGLKSIRTVENKPLFWLYSVGIWACYVIVIAFGFTIVPGIEGLQWDDSFFISVAAGLGFVIPVPGGFGAYHYLVSQALAVMGVPLQLGTAFATIVHSSQSLMFIISGGLGALFLYFAGRK